MDPRLRRLALDGLAARAAYFLDNECDVPDSLHLTWGVAAVSILEGVPLKHGQHGYEVESEGICVDDDDWEFVLAAVDAIRPTYEALLPPKPDTRREPTP